MTSAVQNDKRALVAIDLGAESCRVSLLRWQGDGPQDEPQIELLHRIPNGPVQVGSHLHWPLDRILGGIEAGLRKAAEAAPEGIRSIAVDGWAVDLVRLSPSGIPIHAPFCYRDERSIASKAHADSVVSPEEFFTETGAQPLRINSVYQLLADNAAGIDPATPWLLLPEYVLHWLGGKAVAEYTNATHTGLVNLKTRDWCPNLFARLGLDISAAPPIVPAGSNLGKVSGPLAALPAFADTDLIAPACHDTASAIAAITVDMAHTAYIVSGTWSLVGTVVTEPVNTAAALHAGFTNQGVAAGGYCFHTNINGMWVLKQCLDDWSEQGRKIDLPTLIAQAAKVADVGTINVDAPRLLLAGEMPARINQELIDEGLEPIANIPGNEPIFARLIFSSLATRYAVTLRNLELQTGRKFQQITILGGGSRNTLLSRLTEEATGLPVSAGEAEGSTLGNFAVQLASAEGLTQESLREWATRLATPVAVPTTS